MSTNGKPIDVMLIESAVREGISEIFKPVGRLEALRRRLTLSPGEVEELTGIKAGTLQKWRTQSKGPQYSKEGSVVFYLLADVESWAKAKGVRIGG